MIGNEVHDCIVLVHRVHPSWRVEGARTPLFVCTEMFLELRDIEPRRWNLWSLRERLAEANLAAITLSEFLLPADIDWLERHGARVAHGWYLDRDSDQTLYRDISLGRCIEYDVKARAIRLLKLSLSLQRLVQQHPNLRIFADFPAGSTEWRLLELLRIPTQPYGKSEGPLGSEEPPRRAGSLPALVVTKGRHWGLNAMRVLAGILAFQRSSSEPVAVVRVGLQSVKMLESWLASRREGLRFSLWTSYLMRPRTVLALVKAGASIVSEPSQVRGGDAVQLAEIWSNLARHFSRSRADFYAEWGTALQPLFDETLGGIFDVSFRVACASVDDAYEALDRPNVALLVLPNDCQPLMRAWTLVAKRLAKASLVLQHGHLDYTGDEDHLTADHSAFWSGMVAQEFIELGLGSHQAIVTGSPNADEFRRRRIVPVRNEVSKGSAKVRILIITTGNPCVQAYVGETWVCDYIAGILAALSPRFAELTMTVKLHPGENSSLYRKHLGSRLPSDVHVSDRGNLVQLISEADVVISPPSTVVLEARAAGTPVILIPVPSVDGRKTALQQVEGVVTVFEYGDLPATIDKILAGQTLSATGTWPLSRFLGPLDGKSSDRLLDAVETLVRAPRRFKAADQKPNAGCSHVGR